MQWKQINAAPDVFLVEVPFPNLSTSSTNCYVVRDGDEALVVDTGAPSDEAACALETALREIGVDKANARFFLTHLHLDHAGLVNRVALPGSAVYASKTDLDAMHGAHQGRGSAPLLRTLAMEGVGVGEAQEYVEASRFATGPDLFDDRRFDVRFVEDGDVLHVGRFALQVVATPGHTPGHLSLFQPDAGILFGGDHVLFVISPSIALFPDGEDGLQAYFDSLDKVRALRCGTLLVSHGEIRSDFGERMAWLAEHHRQRLDEMVSVVRKRPRQTGIDVVKGVTWNVPHGRWEDIPAAQRWCIVGVGLSALNHLVDTGRLLREDGEGGPRRYVAANSLDNSSAGGFAV